MSIFGPLGEVFSGFLNRDAAKVQEAQAKIEKEMAKLRAVQISEASRRQLSGVLGTQAAIQATRGVTGATSDVIRRNTREDAYRSEAIARLAEINRAAASALAQKGYAQQAAWAVPLGVIRGITAFEQDAAEVMKQIAAGG